jgi:hypothetical protein
VAAWRRAFKEVTVTTLTDLTIIWYPLAMTSANEDIRAKKNSKLFDIIVLAGMVVNIILAVFLILYYFDFL